MKIAAVIPLRAWSKRIIKKNIKLLNWKPLFTHTLDNAIKSKYINDIIITTDDNDVINIVNNNYKNYLNSKKIIILNRGEKLSGDKIWTIDVILDVLSNNIDIENIILLQWTSPLRDNINIDEAIKLFFDNKNKNIVSVNKVNESPYWQYKINNKWNLENLFDEKYLTYRSQDLAPTYIPNWAIFISSKDRIKNELTFYWKNIIPYIMNKEKSIDIDEILDFKYAEFLLLNKIND